MQEYGHVVKDIHFLQPKTYGLGYPMFVAEKESAWNIVSKTMKYITTMTYRWALSWEEAPMRCIKLPLAKGECLFRSEFVILSQRCQWLLSTEFFGSGT